MKDMSAVQFVDHLPLFEVAVADGAQLPLLFLLHRQLRQSIVLLLIDTLGNLPHFLLQLKQFFVGHVVWVNVDTALVLHAHHHFSDVICVNHLKGLGLLLF